MKKQSYLLPRLLRKDSHITRSRQTVFGGLSSAPEASSHEIAHMEGLSPMTYPAVGTPDKRFKYDVSSASGEPHGIHLHDTLIMAQGDRLYSVTEDGTVTALMTVADSDKCLASFGTCLFILPDRVCYDTADGSVRALSVSTGLLAEATLGTNYVTHSTTNWEEDGFAVGDGIEIHVKDYILGSTTTFLCKVTGISNGTLFLDNSFDRTGEFDMTVSRSFPELSHLCVLGDRLMGYHGHTVYLSEAGNPYNWYVTHELDSDPVTLKIGGAGVITACATYQGYGVFFKEDHLYRLMGNGARDYVLMSMNAPGVASDSDNSLCEVGGQLYYLAPGGVYRFDGDHPAFVGQALSQELTRGVGGTDGTCYYLAARDADGISRLYAYHHEHGLWYVQDLLTATSMATKGDLLFIQTADGHLLRNTRRDETLPLNQTAITETASALPSRIEFGEEFGDGPDGLRLLGIHLRVNGAEGGALTVEVAYDGLPVWETVDVVSGAVKGMVHLPVYPRRAESYRLRLTMMGQWRIYEVTCEYEQGKQ